MRAVGQFALGLAALALGPTVFWTIMFTGTACAESAAHRVQAALVPAFGGYLLGYPLLRRVLRLMRRRGPLRSLMYNVGWVLGLLAAVAIPMSIGVQPRTRYGIAMAGHRNLSAAVRGYAWHMGVAPPSLEALTAEATNARGSKAGPFIERIPCLHPSWTRRYIPGVGQDFTLVVYGELYCLVGSLEGLGEESFPGRCGSLSPS